MASSRLYRAQRAAGGAPKRMSNPSPNPDRPRGNSSGSRKLAALRDCRSLTPSPASSPSPGCSPSASPTAARRTQPARRSFADTGGASAARALSRIASRASSVSRRSSHASLAGGGNGGGGGGEGGEGGDGNGEQEAAAPTEKQVQVRQLKGKAGALKALVTAVREAGSRSFLCKDLKGRLWDIAGLRHQRLKSIEKGMNFIFRYLCKNDFQPLYEIGDDAPNIFFEIWYAALAGCWISYRPYAVQHSRCRPVWLQPLDRIHDLSRASYRPTLCLRSSQSHSRTSKLTALGDGLSEIK